MLQVILGYRDGPLIQCAWYPYIKKEKSGHTGWRPLCKCKGRGQSDVSTSLECQRLPADYHELGERPWTDCLSRASGRSDLADPDLELQTWEFQDCDTVHVCYLSPQFVVVCYSTLIKLIHSLCLRKEVGERQGYYYQFRRAEMTAF